MADETNAASEIDAAVATQEEPALAAEPAVAPVGAVEEPAAPAAAAVVSEVPAVETQDFSGATEQGRMAAELGLTEDACPYGDGDNRDAWLTGFKG